jgi:SAM-dependent MidA family methyltransferase
MNYLEQTLFKWIEGMGPIPFSELMNLALYHPKHGYYVRHAPGDGAAYRTSPTITPWFGRILLRAFELMWHRLGEPEEFVVAEAGGGSGALAEAVLRELADRKDAFFDAIQWLFIEPFPEIGEMQRRRLGDLAYLTSRIPSLEDAGNVTGCVLANEVLDNFPVRVFEVAGGKLAEVRVGADDKQLIEVLVPVEDPGPLGPGTERAGPAVAEKAERAAAIEVLSLLEEDARFEIATEVPRWCADAADCIERGWLLVIDYGDVRPGIWTNRPQGSLVTYEGEALGFEPFAGLGDRDITAHVDFTRLESLARAAGFETSPVMTQRDLLIKLGIDEVAEGLRKARIEADEAGDHGAALSLLAERGRLDLLTARGGMGDFLVLTGAKGAPGLFDAK